MAIVMLYQNAPLVNLYIILSRLEILFPNLCLSLIINVYSKIYNSYRCVYWFFRIVLGQSMCGRKFDYIFVIFVFICVNPLNTSKKCFYLCAFKFNGAN
jgi:hypothetical protein